MKQVGVKILLEHMHFLQFLTTEVEARSLIASWAAGKLKPILSHADVKAPVGVPTADWAVQTSAIRAIHTVPLEQQDSPRFPPNGSGLQQVWR